MKSVVVITEVGKICTGCDQDLPLDAYYKEKTGTLGRRAECKKCWSARTKNGYLANKAHVDAKNQAWRIANPERQAAIYRRSRLRSKFGISIEHYEAMLREQGGCCAACGRSDNGDRRFESFAVDHDHETGKVRGLLCSPCNLALGHAGDDPDRLLALAAYVLQSTDVLAEMEQR